MNPEIKKKWVEALVSGVYTQTINHFRKRINFHFDSNGVDPENYAYCAAGILMLIYEKEVKPIEHWDTIPIEVLEWAGISTTEIGGKHDMADVVEWNDSCELPFIEIAGLIEEFF